MNPRAATTCTTHGPARRAARRVALVVLLLGALVALPAVGAAAHPLGNFTVNQYSGLAIAPDRITLDYVVDMAEIPAFQTQQEIDADGDQRISVAEADRWRHAACPRLGRGLSLSVDGLALALASASDRLSFPPGAGGLPTLRLECAFTATPARPGAHALGAAVLAYADRNFADRVGWREITATGDGTVLADADVPTASTSQRLTRYPQDLLRSPLDQRAARVGFRPGGPRLAGGQVPGAGTAVAGRLPLGVDRATGAIAALATCRDLGLALGLAAVGVALLLGAVHALAPGHGKTVMAAYLVGLRGSPRQALAIGLTVTATHTAGVLALGIALSASRTLAPERLYPWLGLVSGLLLAGIGCGLLRRAVRLRHGRPHDPDHGHPHDHRHPGAHGHDHSGGVAGGRPLSRWGLVAMGFAGGLVPSPSALVVLLGAIALGRAWFGVLLVVAYGAGMAATLTGAGLALSRARSLLDRRGARAAHPCLARLGRALPLASAGLIVMVGLVLAARGASAV